MIRPALAVMAGMLCALAGWRRAAMIRGQAARLRRWTEVLEHLALILSEGASSLPEAFEQAATCALAPDMLLRDLAAGLRSQPLTPLPDLYAAHAQPCAEHETLLRLMHRLSRGTLEARCQAATQAAEEMALLARHYGEHADKDAVMWRNLGFLGGACLTLMLI